MNINSTVLILFLLLLIVGTVVTILFLTKQISPRSLFRSEAKSSDVHANTQMTGDYPIPKNTNEYDYKGEPLPMNFSTIENNLQQNTPRDILGVNLNSNPPMTPIMQGVGVMEKKEWIENNTIRPENKYIDNEKKLNQPYLPSVINYNDSIMPYSFT